MSDRDEARRLLKEAEAQMTRANVNEKIAAARVWAMLAATNSSMPGLPPRSVR